MDIVKKIDGVLKEDSQFKKGDKVKYKEKEWLILALNYPKMTLISLDGKETVNSFGGHGVERVIDEDSESMNFSDETKWSEIAKKKGAKKFIKDPKTGSTFATDDKGNYVGAFDSRAKTGSV